MKISMFEVNFNFFFLIVNVVSKINGFWFRIDEDDDVNAVTKSITAHSKLNVRVSLKKNTSKTDESMIRIHIVNDRLKHPVVLMHLLWINLYENKLVTMNSIPESVTIPRCKWNFLFDYYFMRVEINCNYFIVKSTNFDVSVRKFDLSKE